MKLVVMVEISGFIWWIGFGFGLDLEYCIDQLGLDIVPQCNYEDDLAWNISRYLLLVADLRYGHLIFSCSPWFVLIIMTESWNLSSWLYWLDWKAYPQFKV